MLPPVLFALLGGDGLGLTRPRWWLDRVAADVPFGSDLLSRNQAREHVVRSRPSYRRGPMHVYRRQCSHSIAAGDNVAQIQVYAGVTLVGVIHVVRDIDRDVLALVSNLDGQNDPTRLRNTQRRRPSPWA